MDKATFIGLFSAFGIVVGAAYHQTHGKLMAFYSTEGVLLVVVGAIFATMISMPMSNFKEIFRVTKKCLFYKETSLPALIQTLVEFATIARKDGLLALEGQVQSIEDAFLAKGLRMVIDGTDSHEVEMNLRLEMAAMAERHAAGKKMFATMGNYGPAYGLMATIIGQVVMFQNMGGDISAIGAGLSVALLGTLYGSVLANIVCSPFADKLGLRASQEAMLRELQLHGILGIAQGDSPTALKQKLVGFVDGRGAARLEIAK
jgi:chemotaxis protein MotA